MVHGSKPHIFSTDELNEKLKKWTFNENKQKNHNKTELSTGGMWIRIFFILFQQIMGTRIREGKVDF